MDSTSTKNNSFIKNFFTNFKQIIKSFISHFNQSEFDKRFVILSSAWIFCIFFFSVYLLAKKNPYSILNPLEYHNIPAKDERKKIPIFLSDGKGNVFSFQKKVLLMPNQMNENISLLIHEVGESPYNEDTLNNADEYKDNLKKLPNLQLALIHSFFIKNTGHLILDFRESSVLQELDSIKVSIKKIEEEVKNSEELKKKGSSYNAELERIIKEKKVREARLLVFASTFKCIEKTLFINFSEIKSIEYKLDGRSKDIIGIQPSFTTVRMKE